MLPQFDQMIKNTALPDCNQRYNLDINKAEENKRRVWREKQRVWGEEKPKGGRKWERGAAGEGGGREGMRKKGTERDSGERTRLDLIWKIVMRLALFSFHSSSQSPWKACVWVCCSGYTSVFLCIMSCACMLFKTLQTFKRNSTVHMGKRYDNTTVETNTISFTNAHLDSSFCL